MVGDVDMWPSDALAAPAPQLESAADIQVNVIVADVAVGFIMAPAKTPLSELRKQMNKELKAALRVFPVGWLFLLNGVCVMKAQEKKFNVGQLLHGSSISVAADATAHVQPADEKTVAPEVAAAAEQKAEEKAAKAAAKEQERAEKAAAKAEKEASKAERDAAKAAKEAEKENARLAKEATKAQKEQEQAASKAEREQAKAAKEAEKAEKERARALKAAERERKALEPKMPCSAYVSFVSATSAAFRAAHPDQKPPEIMKLQAAAWKELSAEERAPHDKRAEEDLERYLAECQAAGIEPKRGKKQQPQQQQPQRDPTTTAESPASCTPGWLREAAGAVGLVDELETPCSDGSSESAEKNCQQLAVLRQQALPIPDVVSALASAGESPMVSAREDDTEDEDEQTNEILDQTDEGDTEEEDEESVLVSNLKVINVD